MKNTKFKNLAALVLALTLILVISGGVFGAALPALPVRASLQASYLPPVYNQGNLNTSTAFAITTAMGYVAKAQGSSSPLKSALFLYYNGRALEGTVPWDAGMAVYSGITAAKTRGVCNATLWPYIESKFQVKPTSRCYSEGTGYRILDSTTFVSQDPLAIKTVIAGGRPVVFSITAYESLFSSAVSTTGDIPMPDVRREILAGSHTLVITGYDDTTQRYTVRNSWSTSWGRNGNGTIPYNYVHDHHLAFDFNKITRVGSR